ncbi:hypothetical protein MTO96_041607 [Rhipicephalus appendiculatus]
MKFSEPVCWYHGWATFGQTCIQVCVLKDVMFLKKITVGHIHTFQLHVDGDHIEGAQYLISYWRDILLNIPEAGEPHPPPPPAGSVQLGALDGAGNGAIAGN